MTVPIKEANADIGHIPPPQPNAAGIIGSASPVNGPQDRSRERLRRVTLGSATAVVSKGIHVGTMLLIVPLTLSHLGAERYGLWMTITSFLMLLTFADFGLGNGLLNAVATAAGRRETAQARRAISTATVLLAGIAVMLTALFGVTYQHIAWGRLFNASTPEMTREGARAALVLFLCIAVGLPFGVTQRVQAGHEETHVSNLWQAAGSVLALLALWGAVAMRGSLPALVAAAAGGPLVAWIAATVHEFSRRRPSLKPSLRSFSTDEARRLLRMGGLFVVLQLAAVILGSVDNIIISHVLGPKEVTSLAVPARLFAIVPLLVGLALGPLWPAYAAAKAQGDVGWVGRTMVRSIVAAAALAGFAGTVLTVFGPLIIRAWVGDAVSASPVLLSGLAVWNALSSVGGAQGIALNGIGVLRVQAVCAVVATILAVIAKIVLARRFGVEGVVWAGVPIYLLVVLLPGAVAARHHLASAKTAQGSDPAWQRGE